MIKTLELRGYKSLRALNAFHTLMLGVKMLPPYMAEQYEDFYNRLDSMSEADQEKMIRQAAIIVELQKEEVESIVCFACDRNGVPYTAANLNNLKADELFEIIVAVCCQIAKIKINFVTEAEKKN